jgi:hypothetical protein
MQVTHSEHGQVIRGDFNWDRSRDLDMNKQSTMKYI